MPKLQDVKRELFCQEFVIHFNGARAMRSIGVEGDSAPSMAYQWRREPAIAARIAELTTERMKQVESSVDRLAAELTFLSQANMDDFITIGDDGSAWVDLSACTREQKGCIQEIYTEEVMEGRSNDGQREIRKTKVKLYDKTKAIDLLGKHHKMFTEKVEHTGANGAPLEIEVVYRTAPVEKK